MLVPLLAGENADHENRLDRIRFSDTDPEPADCRDVTDDGQIAAGDVFAIFPFWLVSVSDAGWEPRYDLDASLTVSAGDVFSIFPWWLASCS